MSEDILHIYPQQYWHDHAHIVGTVEALTKLREAITRAIVGADKSPCIVFVNDGEGYEVEVHKVSDATASNLRNPYQDEIAHDQRPCVAGEHWWIFERSKS